MSIATINRDEDQSATFSLATTAQGPTVVLGGDWTATAMDAGDTGLVSALADVHEVIVDLSGVRRLDVAGAHRVSKAAEAQHRSARYIARPAIQRSCSSSTRR